MAFFKNFFRNTTKAEAKETKREPLFITHKEKIYPWVKVVFKDVGSEDATVHLDLNGEDAPISRNWLGDLVIFYAVDMGDNFQMLQERDLPHDISKGQLHQIAIENLNRDVEYKLQQTDFGAFGLLAGGDHEAGAICLPAMWEWLADHFGESLIVAVPSKDLLLIIPESDTDGVANLKIFVHQIFQDGNRLLTRNLFRYDKGSQTWEITDCVQENASR